MTSQFATGELGQALATWRCAAVWAPARWRRMAVPRMRPVHQFVVVEGLLDEVEGALS
jgi:hypothetical protein